MDVLEKNTFLSIKIREGICSFISMLSMAILGFFFAYDIFIKNNGNPDNNEWFNFLNLPIFATIFAFILVLVPWTLFYMQPSLREDRIEKERFIYDSMTLNPLVIFPIMIYVCLFCIGIEKNNKAYDIHYWIPFIVGLSIYIPSLIISYITIILHDRYERRIFSSNFIIPSSTPNYGSMGFHPFNSNE
jgi:hypothetical protein